MKKLVTLLAAFALLGNVVGQTTITLQPGPVLGKDAMIWNADGFANNSNTNYGTSNQLLVHAWTNAGIPDTSRSLIQFDLSVIPTNSIVNDAKLSIYNNPNAGGFNGQHSNLGGPNSSTIQRITSDWDESILTWNTQPTTTTQNEVMLPQSTNPNQDFTDINVTSMVQDMVDSPLISFGFIIRLQTEVEHRALVFASSDYADTTRHPKLEITYTPPVGIEDAISKNKFSIYPNPSTGKFSVAGATGEIQVYDLFGRLLLRSNEPEIDMSSYPMGLYVWQVGTSRGKLIIE